MQIGKDFIYDEYDVVVVGAGHAGCEAAFAAARMGMKTAILTINLDGIALLSCNPNIGGTGKGHLVREIDALGGQMGLIIDETYIQSRMLNTSKGPAVHSLRAQADKRKYHEAMKKALENQENLTLKMAEVIDIIIEGGKVTGVRSLTGAIYKAKAVILCTGTYLGGRIYIGECNYESGPDGMHASTLLAKSLRNQNFPMRRMKTGTPARVHSDSINYSVMEVQKGDEEVIPFSFLNQGKDMNKEQIDCYLTYTTTKTHDIIKENINRSAMYLGDIEGSGPRYCPSIEDKVVRFHDKDKHQVFIEPEGIDNKEMYIQGVSTSLPEDVQLKLYHNIIGLENCKFTRTSYAIEYDSIKSTELKLSLEHKDIENLYFAGQINGSSGYEEAAAQGIMAGINAALKLKCMEPFIIDRSEGYIGVLIDDLVTKGTNEPYRMMTSRAEYRLTLRQDNADMRLTERGYEIGLVTKERYQMFKKKKEMLENELERLKKVKLNPNEKTNAELAEKNIPAIKNTTALYDIIKRPEANYENLASLDPERPDLPREIRIAVETEIKYEGYIKKQSMQIEQFKKLENKKLNDIDYSKVPNLSNEARQKLTDLRPDSIGQASRITGISPADITMLMIYLEQKRREKEIANKN